MKKDLQALILAIIVGGLIYLGFDLKNQERPAPIIPMEDFFRNPTKTGFKISPDGSKLAFLQPWKDRLNVHVQEISSGEITRVTQSEERDIAGYIWNGNNRLTYVKDQGGDENWRIYAVNTDGSAEKLLTPFDKVQARLVDDLEEDPEHILVSLNQRDPRFHDVYRLNVMTGELVLLAENPGNISSWMTDHDGKLRIATTTDGVHESILYRDTEDDSFRVIVTVDFKETLSPLFFTFDNENLYVASNRGRDKSAIFKFDLRTATEGELIFEHPKVDVYGLMYSKKRKILTGVSYTEDKTTYVFFDEDREDLQNELEKRLPDVEVRVTDFSKDESKTLVRAFTDKTRGKYYFYDRNSKDLVELANISPWLNEEYMASMKPIKYTSRDGLTIHGYLTLPIGRRAKNLPIVVNPHGGPWARDYWGFNPEAQFLANRGYVVLQMNFRGSTGYGREFWESSFKEWGKSMQDDITDGVNWLIKKRIADPDRIAIYGGSYGGYATLAGVTFTPDLYACGVDYVGPSNIFTLLASFPPYWELYREMFYEMVGDPEEDKELLEEISPLFHVDNIKVPLLIAQGANDPRVKQAEADQIVSALQEKGIEYEYLLKENEGHGFRNEENRFDFYRAMEKFLEKHIGG
ncbi:MAG: S9 family peptidase [Fidelibacterota bacterium]